MGDGLFKKRQTSFHPHHPQLPYTNSTPMFRLLCWALWGIPNGPKVWKCPCGSFLEDVIDIKINNYQGVHTKYPAMVTNSNTYMSQTHVYMTTASSCKGKTWSPCPSRRPAVTTNSSPFLPGGDADSSSPHLIFKEKLEIQVLCDNF